MNEVARRDWRWLSQFAVGDWAAIGLIAVAAVLGALHILFGLPLVLKILWTEEAAGWAQTVGAVAAIGVAIAVPAAQHRRDVARELSRERQLRINSLLALVSVLDRARVATKMCEEGAGKSNVPWNTIAQSIQENRRVLSEIPVFQLPVAELVPVLGVVNEHMNQCISIVNIFAENLPRMPATTDFEFITGTRTRIELATAFCVERLREVAGPDEWKRLVGISQQFEQRVAAATGG